MTTTTVKVEGFRELEKELEKLGDPTKRKTVARRVLKKVAQPLATLMQQRAPVDKGHLKRSIAVSTKLASGNAGSTAFGQALRSGASKEEAVQALRDARRASASLVELFVGPGQHPQGITQEFGTINHPPQPFVRPAWDQEQGAMLERIKAELWADIVRTVARADKKAAKG